MKRALLGALFGIVAAASAATAQQFTPTKTVDIVVHTGAGGGNDAACGAAGPSNGKVMSSKFMSKKRVPLKHIMI